jgi:hypothetical protein
VIIDAAPFPAPPTEEQKAREKRNERREGRRFFVECLTALLVLIYATVALFQWRAMRDTNALTAQAVGLNQQMFALNKQMFAAYQAAGFECQMAPPRDNRDPWMILTCTNEGNVAARNLLAQIAFVRKNSASRIEQRTSRTINRDLVIKGGIVQQLFHVSLPYDPNAWAQQDFSASASLAYQNGLEPVTQHFCWKLIVTAANGSMSWTDCDNAPDLRKYPR